MTKPKDYRSHRMPSNYRKTAGGKGDRDRSDHGKVQENLSKIFPDKKYPHEDRDMSWLEEEQEGTSDE